MRWALAVLLAAGCGRCGFSATTDAVATDVAPASRSTLSIDRIDPGGTLLDFPLLVTLDDTRAARDLLDATASNLRFVDASGTVLAHEIDQVGTAGPTGAPLLAWVRVPMIVGTTTTIAVEIGGALPAPSSLPVWVSTYEAVYHMTDSTDATPHHDDLTPFNANMIVATSGCALGSCQSFNGSNTAFLLPDAQRLDLPATTISAWVYERTVAPMIAAVVSRGVMNSANQDFLLGLFTGGSYAAADTQGGGPTSYTGGAVVLGHWTHLAMTCDSTRLTLYEDGIQQGFVTTSGLMLHDPMPIVIAAGITNASAPNNYFLDGMVDELRIEHVVHDGAYMQYEDAAMRDQLISYGPIQR